MCRHANCTHTHTQWHSNIMLIIWLAWPLSLCQAELQSWWNENMLPGCYQTDRVLTLGGPASSSRKWHWMDESPLMERLWSKTHWLRATKKSKYLKPPGGCNIVPQFVPKDPLWHRLKMIYSWDSSLTWLFSHCFFLLPALPFPQNHSSINHWSRNINLGSPRRAALVLKLLLLALMPISPSNTDPVNTPADNAFLTDKLPVYLNGSHLEVSGNLLLPDLFQGCHGDPNIIQVFDWPVQLLLKFLNNCKNVFHLSPVLFVAVTANDNHPGFRLGSQGKLQVSCRRSKTPTGQSEKLGSMGKDTEHCWLSGNTVSFEQCKTRVKNGFQVGGTAQSARALAVLSVSLKPVKLRVQGEILSQGNKMEMSPTAYPMPPSDLHAGARMHYVDKCYIQRDVLHYISFIL